MVIVLRKELSNAVFNLLAAAILAFVVMLVIEAFIYDAPMGNPHPNQWLVFSIAGVILLWLIPPVRGIYSAMRATSDLAAKYDIPLRDVSRAIALGLLHQPGHARWSKRQLYGFIRTASSVKELTGNATVRIGIPG